eukprot:scaffold4195_cov250-Pinguiococcus_pyrenoidosus.AAC.9
MQFPTILTHGRSWKKKKQKRRKCDALFLSLHGISPPKVSACSFYLQLLLAASACSFCLQLLLAALENSRNVQG